MKRINKVLSLITMILVVIMLTGCLSIDMKVGKNGSLDMTYTIDTSQTQGMMSFKDIEKAIEESVDGMNDTADKKIAKLKSVKENKSKKTVTAEITVSDINKMGDGSFFGTVKEYRKEDGYGLDDLVNTKGKSVDEKKVSDKLQMVYFPMGGTDEYGLVEVKVTVPGNIEYLTDGAEVDKKNVALFSGQNPIVVFKKGGGFPFLLLLIIAAVVVAFFMMKKKSSSAPASTAPVAATPQAPVQAPPQNVAPQSPPAEPPTNI
ncbi:MAG: hypothetical protein GX625_03935 [Clostridiaceae bacterium]|nr:hypothetical protein [Clostridiaceae bacterium]